jgi:arsenate reductase
LKTYNILFLCTHNAARSIIAEVLANSHISKKFHGYSAGSHPKATINPFAIEIAMDCLYPLDKLRTKNWEEFGSFQSPKMDFIITICADVVTRRQPYWPGNPVVANWSFSDPTLVEGTEEKIRKEFKLFKVEIQRRLDILASIPFHKLDQEALQAMHTPNKESQVLPLRLNEIRNGLGFLP